MSIETLSASDFAPPKPVPYFEYVKTGVRNVGVFLTRENPLFWAITSGRSHKQADLEGPYFLTGSPDRQVADGKSVMASPDMLKRFVPFLMVVRVVGPDGKPVPNATLDWWQADSDSIYYYAAYTLRGKARTDSQGYAEVLTVPPGPYGPTNSKRAGHFHVIVRSLSKSHTSSLVTQIYVCDGNDEKSLSSDFLNFVRKPRPGNMVHTWSIEGDSEEKGIKDWPILPAEEELIKTKVAWWNEKLTQASSDLKISACAVHEIQLNASWF